MSMIYIVITVTMLILLIFYSFIETKRRDEEVKYKQNSYAIKTWLQIINNKGDKNV